VWVLSTLITLGTALTSPSTVADIAVDFETWEEHCEFSITLEHLNRLSEENWQTYATSECIEDAHIVIHVYGQISQKDAYNFRQALPRILEVRNLRYESIVNFYLYSPGGDIFAAIEIGNLIREYLLDSSLTWVPWGAECLSACVIIYASGPEKRMANPSKLGVHRPYFSDERFIELGYDTRKQAYRAAYKALEMAFDDYNVSTEIVDLMWSKPSTQIYYLTDEEIKKFRLIGRDLVLQETDAARLRKHCGQNAHLMKQAYNGELREFSRRRNEHCSSQHPVPAECHWECGSSNDKCPSECGSIYIKLNECYTSDRFTEQSKQLHDKHRDYIECRKKYFEESAKLRKENRQ
jgi:hypothetical protein